MDDELKKQCDEYLAGWKRAAADLINYKKEEGQRLDDAVRYASTKILCDILPVLDSFGLALPALTENEDARKGMTLIKSQLEDALRRHGIERIPVSPGDALSPELHEAMLEEEGEPDKIIAELAAGYTLRGKVIRAAKVKIGK